jgi:hypothetical protein
MSASRSICRRFFRGLLVAGLCYSLVLQALLVQAADLAAATAETQFPICHGNGDQTPPAGDDGSLQTRCHFCWLPASDTALMPDASPGLFAPIAIVGSGYSFSSESFVVIRPPPRGASRAPPHLA